MYKRSFLHSSCVFQNANFPCCLASIETFCFDGYNVNFIKGLCRSCKFHLVGFLNENLNNFKRIETLKNLKLTKREKNKKTGKLFFSELTLKRKKMLWNNELILFEEVSKVCIKIPEKMKK